MQYQYQHLSSSGGNLMVDAFIESKIDLTRFDDILQFSCNFEKLSAIIKILIL